MDAGKSAGRIVLRANVPDIAPVREQAARELSGYYAAIENLDWNVGPHCRRPGTVSVCSPTPTSSFLRTTGTCTAPTAYFARPTLTNEAIRVPLIISGIDRLYGLHRGPSAALVSNVDIAPTSLGLCGLPVPKTMQGRDLSNFRLHGPAVETPDSAYLQLIEATAHHDSVDRPFRGLVSDDGWKYVCLENQPWLLFNLNNDPYEQVNLALNSRYRPNANIFMIVCVAGSRRRATSLPCRSIDLRRFGQQYQETLKDL